MCVSQCPDKFTTYTEMQLQRKFSKNHWEYYRQFCKPGFNNPDKVAILYNDKLNSDTNFHFQIFLALYTTTVHLKWNNQKYWMNHVHTVQ